MKPARIVSGVVAGCTRATSWFPQFVAKGRYAGLAVLGLLPLATYAFFLTLMIEQQQRKDIDERLGQEAASIVAALERELVAEVSALSGLAVSRTIDNGDLAGFRYEAERLILVNQHWRAVELIDATGETRLVGTRYSKGTAPPVLRPRTARHVMATGKPLVEELSGDTFLVYVPVEHDQKVVAVLAADIDARRFAADLRRSVEQPPGWIVTVADAANRIVVRFPGEEANLGLPVSQSFTDLASARPGQVADTALRGMLRVYGIVLPLGGAANGWHVGVAVSHDTAWASFTPVRRMLIAGMVLSLGAAALIAAGAFWRALSGAEKQAERISVEARLALRAASSKEQMLATVSHELRAPLHGVLGFTELLAKSGLTPQQRQWVEHQRTAGLSLRTIVDDVLDYAKVQEGRLRLENINFDLHALLRAAADLIRPAAEAKGVRVELAIPDALPRWAHGDPTRIRQVLDNLLSNARKFTDQGQIRLVVSRQARSENAFGLSIMVEDSGVGVPHERIDRLFERFEQADISTARLYGGSGLGLAICRDLVHLMGGRISVTSGIGQGTTFHVYLSLGLGQRPATVEARTNLASRRGRILVADDQETNWILVREFLERAGHRVETVGDGAAAVAAVEAGQFDLVLLDLRMPIMSGTDAAMAIRRLAIPQAATLPLVAMTGDALPETLAACHAAGMTAHIAKPVGADELCAEVEALLAAQPVPRVGSPTRMSPGQATPWSGPSRVRSLAAGRADRLLRACRDQLGAIPGRLAAAGGDLEATEAIAHGLFGSAGMMGLISVSREAMALQDACRAKDHAAAEAATSHLLEAIEEAAAMLEAQPVA